MVHQNNPTAYRNKGLSQKMPLGEGSGVLVKDTDNLIGIYKFIY